MQYLEQVPDSIKVSVATSSSVLTLFGFPVEQWMYVASAIVSILFIIEKIPVVISRMKTFIRWLKNVKS